MSTEIQAWADDGIDIRALILRLWERKWLIVGVALLGGAIAVSISYTITPVYRAQVVMVSASADRTGLTSMLSSALGSIGNLASLAGANLGSGDSAVEEALAVMRSRQFTEEFIREHGLLSDLFPKDWDAAAKKWKVPTDKQPTMARAFKRFNSNVREVSRDKKTGLIVLTIDWPDRPRAASLANAMVARLNAEMRVRAMSQSDASLKYLNEELAGTAVVDTREAINRLIEAQVRQRMIASVTQEFSFRVVDVAMTPDLIDKVRPKRFAMLMLGLVLGGLIACAWVYFRPASVK